LILDHVRETGSDLLVMGAYDDSIGERLALGSTTDYLIHNSPVPTLVHH
jgi:nucleotide-binding universal stress UspA family protein